MDTDGGRSSPICVRGYAFGLTKTGTELIPAAKLSDDTGPP
jgi:hypothetical protein